MKRPPKYEVVREVVARERLRGFIRHFWGEVDSFPFVSNWHIDAIADHLQAVHDFEIARLCICIAPRAAKSRLCSVLFPAYAWAERPDEDHFMVSYDQGLEVGFAKDRVKIIQSELYKQVFPKGARISQKRVPYTDFYTDQGGRCYSTITGGRATGAGGSLQVMDDLVKAQVASSDDPKLLENAVTAMDGTLASRAKGDPEKFRRVLVQQRLHPRDPAGHAMKDLGWEALVIPMEYSKSVSWDCSSSLEFVDPRTEDGELFFPSLWTRKAVDRLRKELSGAGGTERFVAAQLQQNPTPEGGTFIDRSWFGMAEEVPWKRDSQAYFFSTTDPNHKKTKKVNSRAAMGFFAIYQNRLYILDATAAHLRYPDFKAEWVRLHEGPWAAIQRALIEDKANGTPLIDELGYSRDPDQPHDSKQKFAARVKPVEPGALSKEERIRPETDVLRQGKVVVVRGGWNEAFLDEVSSFPGGKHDDLVDVLQMACQHFRERCKGGGFKAMVQGLDKTAGRS